MELSLRIVLVILWLPVDWVSSQRIEQNPQHLSIQEGEEAILTCNFTNYSPAFLQWYRQDLGRGLVFLLLIRENQHQKQTGRLRATFDTATKQSSFHITASQPADSATYLCAADWQAGTALIFGKGTTVSVRSNIQNATPAVYQLESHKSDTPICLFTDFDSKTNVSSVLNDTVISSENTVLDMKATNSKSNGVLVWSNTATLRCEEISDKISYYSSAGIPCDAKLIEKGFETDINLNSQNLSVIALRILLLKVVGFNLLMTLRLWSS